MTDMGNKSCLIKTVKSSIISTLLTLILLALIVNFAPTPVANIFLNPLGVVKGLQHAQEQQMAHETKNSQDSFKKALASKKDQIFDQSAPFLGSKDAKVEIVVFSDYKCGYCRAFDEVIEKVLSNPSYHGKVKFIIKEFPILSRVSNFMAIGALEVFKKNPEKYNKFHTLLYKSDVNSQEDIVALGKKVGTKLTLEENPEIMGMLSKNRSLATDLGIRGTPAIIIGEEFIGGFIGESDLIARIDAQLAK